MSVQALTWVLEHSRAEHSARLVAIALANHAGTDGADAYPSIPTIAREARIGESTVRAAIEQLKDLGEIEEVGVSRLRTRVFRFPMTPADSGPPQILDPRRIQRLTPQILAADPAGSAPEPSLTVPQPEDTPPTPRKRGEPGPPPERPVGDRARDHQRYRRDLQRWLLANLEAPTDADHATWTAARSRLAGLVPNTQRGIWLDPLQLVGRLRGDLALAAPGEQTDWVRDRFLTVIQQAVGAPVRIIPSLDTEARAA